MGLMAQGADRPAAGETAALLFRPRTAVAMVAVAAFSFCAFMALLAYAPDLKGGSDGAAHALSRSAIGYAGVTSLLRRLGQPVIISRGRTSLDHVRRGLLVLTPPPGASAKAVGKFPADRPTLLVLPKWIPFPDPLKAGWTDKVGVLPAPAVTSAIGELTAKPAIERRRVFSRPVLRTTGQVLEAGRSFQLGRIDSLQTLAGADLIPVIVDEQGATVLALSRKRSVYILSDPDLLNTQGIADLDTARAAVGVLEQLRAPGPVVFDVTLDGFERGRSLLRLALEPPLLGATLCLLAAALLMGWQAMIRFGPELKPARALALGARALADNSAALVRMARREPRMGAPYAALVREAAARALGAPRDLDAAQLDALLDRLGEARGAGPFSPLAAQARGAANNTDLIAAARRLNDWKLEITRERR